MDIFQIKLKVLRDSLYDKENILTAILGITENLEAVYNALLTVDPSDAENLRSMINEMNAQKQALIDQVISNDSAFQTIFGELNSNPDEFDENCRLNKVIIEDMQKEIRALTDLDMKIRLNEKRNEIMARGLTGHARKPVVDIPKESPRRLIEAYQRNTRLGKLKKRT